MSDHIQAGCMEYRPSFAMRCWLKLGFRYGAHAPRPEDDDAQYSVHGTFVHWDWKDRIRILLSGKVEVQLCVRTERAERLLGTTSHAVVLAPDMELPGAHS